MLPSFQQISGGVGLPVCSPRNPWAAPWVAGQCHHHHSPYLAHDLSCRLQQYNGNKIKKRKENSSK